MKCELCPNRCGIDRSVATGKCGAGNHAKVARAALHMWEEPILVGKGGSGAVFFSHCTMRCVYCQNHEISADGYGKEISDERLGEIFLSLERHGAENINLVSPTPYVYNILNALNACQVKPKIPIACNVGGYELAKTVDILSSFATIFMPDFKYGDSESGYKYSGAKDYPQHALRCIERMLEKQPHAVVENGVLKRGVIVRHLVLPSRKDDSIKILRTLADTFGTKGYYLSLMRQYTPCHRAFEYKELNRRLTSYEYDKVAQAACELGFEGFLQEKPSADLKYVPDFDLTGV